MIVRRFGFFFDDDVFFAMTPPHLNRLNCNGRQGLDCIILCPQNPPPKKFFILCPRTGRLDFWACIFICVFFVSVYIFLCPHFVFIYFYVQQRIFQKCKIQVIFFYRIQFCSLPYSYQYLSVRDRFKTIRKRSICSFQPFLNGISNIFVKKDLAKTS